MRYEYRLTMLALILLIGITAQAAINFQIVLPREAIPEDMTILCGRYGNGLGLSPVDTQKGVNTYTVKLLDNVQRVKLLIHQPGYQIVAAEIEKRDFGKPFTPKLIPLGNHTVHLRLLDTKGNPVPGEQLTIMDDWDSMQYFGYAGGMVFSRKRASVKVTTDQNGEATVILPAWIDDPYYASVIREAPFFSVPTNGEWDYLPARIQAQHEYPDPVVITKQYHAKLTVRFDTAFIARHGLQKILGDSFGDGRAIVVIQDPANRTTQTMRHTDGSFTVILHPGTFSLGIEIVNKDANGKSRIRYIPLLKELTLKEKEERVIVIDRTQEK
ncbi:MAG: Ig-like domain-containing protein [Armatimonadota bacterium]